MRSYLVVITAAALAGCNTPANPEPTSADPPAASLSEADLDEPFTLEAGGAAHVGAAGLTVRFEGVSADSRCPVDVTCVWEGDVVVDVVTVRSGAERAWQLHSAADRVGPGAVVVDGLRLELVGVEPAPREGMTIPQGDYRATLRVTRANGG